MNEITDALRQTADDYRSWATHPEFGRAMASLMDSAIGHLERGEGKEAIAVIEAARAAANAAGHRALGAML